MKSKFHLLAILLFSLFTIGCRESYPLFAFNSIKSFDISDSNQLDINDILLGEYSALDTIKKYYSDSVYGGYENAWYISFAQTRKDTINSFLVNDLWHNPDTIYCAHFMSNMTNRITIQSGDSCVSFSIGANSIEITKDSKKFTPISLLDPRATYMPNLCSGTGEHAVAYSTLIFRNDSVFQYCNWHCWDDIQFLEDY
jgi:hypothetical protein